MRKKLYDKVLHFLAGYAIAHVADMRFGDQWEPSGIVSALGAGIGKEVYDRLSGKGTPETWDAIATMLGGVAYQFVKVNF